MVLFKVAQSCNHVLPFLDHLLALLTIIGYVRYSFYLQQLHEMQRGLHKGTCNMNTVIPAHVTNKLCYHWQTCWRWVNCWLYLAFCSHGTSLCFFHNSSSVAALVLDTELRAASCLISSPGVVSLLNWLFRSTEEKNTNTMCMFGQAYKRANRHHMKYRQQQRRSS